MARTCDWRTSNITDQRCGKPARQAPHDWVVDHAKIHGDFCDDHEVDLRNMLLGVGFTMEAKLVDHKPRHVHMGDSGQPFSTAEARAWLIEKGIIATAGGRVSRAHLRMYAETH